MPPEGGEDSKRVTCGKECQENLVKTTVVLGGVSYVVWKIVKTCGCTLVAGPGGGLVCLVTP